MMKDSRVMNADELPAFLNSSRALAFTGSSRAETYAWIERTLRSYKFLSRPRLEKGLLRQYMQKMTGISSSQLTRLITQFRCTGHVPLRPYQRHHFPTKYTPDQLLLAEGDKAHDRLSGPATLAILKREVACLRPSRVPTTGRHLYGTPVPAPSGVHLL